MPLANLGPKEVLEGAIHALTHAGQLCDDANLLFREGRFASAVVLATSGREELGRFSFLVERFLSLEPNGTVSADDLRSSCDDHIAKLRRGQRIIHLPMPTELAERFRAAAEKGGSTPDTAAVLAQIDAIAKVKRRREPHDAHERRLRAQYVEPREDGSWSTPAQLTRDEANVFVRTITFEFVNTAMVFQQNENAQQARARHRLQYDEGWLPVLLARYFPDWGPSGPNVDPRLGK